MTDTLQDIASQARSQFFTLPLLDSFILETVPEAALWSHYDPALFAYYPRDLFFQKNELPYSETSQRFQSLNNTASDIARINDSLIIREAKTGIVVGLFNGWQKNTDHYYMHVTAIHRDYRRRGIYSALLDRMIDYTRFIGFRTILSCHSPANNNILIAKLKKKFKITSLEIDGLIGINVWLCYFHDRELQRAYEFRCGHIDFSPAMFSASEGTAEELYIALKKAKHP